jgi:methylornithine synthase
MKNNEYCGLTPDGITAAAMAAKAGDFSALVPKYIDEITRDESVDLSSFFAEARRVREEVFGNEIFLYGFVYFSTHCGNNCRFCYYRRDNQIHRYRKTEDEVVNTARELANSGVHLIDLTMGEDPLYHSDGFRGVSRIVSRVKEETGLPVMVSPGVVSPEVVRRFARSGADFFALYQETHNRKLFRQLRIDQDYDQRMLCKLEAKAAGMRIEEGILSGAGESADDLVHSLQEMGRIGADQVRVMSFVPQEATPMETFGTGNRQREYVLIALMRLLYPHALIPASLDVDGLVGLRARLDAGANVVTSIIPPKSGYQGVAQAALDVDAGGRTVKEVTGTLTAMGLRPATAGRIHRWLVSRS